MTFNLQAQSDYGHTGQYVARITGRHAKFTFAREFLGRKRGKSGGVSSADVDTPGLYEECNVSRKNGKSSDFWVSVDGAGAQWVSKEMAMAIAKALDDGRAVAEIVVILGEGDERTVELRTPAQAENAKAATTLDEAVAQCAAILAALPAPLARKALTEIRRQVVPATARKNAQDKDPPAEATAPSVAESEAP